MTSGISWPALLLKGLPPLKSVTYLLTQWYKRTSYMPTSKFGSAIFLKEWRKSGKAFSQQIQLSCEDTNRLHFELPLEQSCSVMVFEIVWIRSSRNLYSWIPYITSMNWTAARTAAHLEKPIVAQLSRPLWKPKVTTVSKRARHWSLS